MKVHSLETVQLEVPEGVLSAEKVPHLISEHRAYDVDAGILPPDQYQAQFEQKKESSICSLANVGAGNAFRGIAGQTMAWQKSPPIINYITLIRSSDQTIPGLFCIPRPHDRLGGNAAERP